MTAEDLAQVILLDCMSLNMPWPLSAYRHELQNEASRPWVAEAVLQAPLTFETALPMTMESITKAAGEKAVLGMLVLWMILDEAHIATLAVHPQMRRQGIARLILQTALIGAAREGASTAFLEVRAGNTGAQKLYEGFGFKLAGRRPHYYKDNGEDALLLTLEGLSTNELQRSGPPIAKNQMEDER